MKGRGNTSYPNCKTKSSTEKLRDERLKLTWLKQPNFLRYCAFVNLLLQANPETWDIREGKESAEKPRNRSNVTTA